MSQRSHAYATLCKCRAEALCARRSEIWRGWREGTKGEARGDEHRVPRLLLSWRARRGRLPVRRRPAIRGERSPLSSIQIR